MGVTLTQGDIFMAGLCSKLPKLEEEMEHSHEGGIRAWRGGREKMCLSESGEKEWQLKTPWQTKSCIGMQQNALSKGVDAIEKSIYIVIIM